MVVLVDEAAESVAAVDLAVAGSVVSLVGLGRPEFERTVRARAVVLDVDAEHVFEVTAVEDHEPVQALGTHGPHEAFCDRVRLRCSHGRLDDSDAITAEDLVEGAVVFAVAVADQETHAVVGKGRGRGCAPAG